MTWEPLIAIGVMVLAAVAGSSIFVRAASERDREIHLREDAAHRAVRRRGLLPTGSLPLEAGPLLPAEPVPPPMARSPRRGGARLRLRYAALVLLAWAMPGASGPDAPESRTDSTAANPGIERALEDAARPEVRPDCAAAILAAGSPAPAPSRDRVHKSC